MKYVCTLCDRAHRAGSKCGTGTKTTRKERQAYALAARDSIAAVKDKDPIWTVESQLDEIYDLLENDMSPLLNRLDELMPATTKGPLAVASIELNKARNMIEDASNALLHVSETWSERITDAIRPVHQPRL